MGALAIQLIGVPGVRLLLAVLQACAGMSFQHTVFRAVMPTAKAAVPDNPLSGFLAFLEIAARLARSHVGKVASRGGSGGDVGGGPISAELEKANCRLL